MKPITLAPAAAREDLTVAEFAPLYLDRYVRGTGRRGQPNRPSEVARKEYVLRSHILPALGHVRLRELNEEYIDAFKTALLHGRKVGARPLSAKTVNNRVTILSTLMRVAKRWGYVKSVPDFGLHAGPRPDIRFLEAPEIHTLLALAADEQPWHSMLVVALNTGMRIGELRALQWLDVHMTRKVIIVRRSLDQDGTMLPPKNGLTREIGINDAAARAFKALLRVGPYVFCSMPKGEPLSYSQCRDTITRYRSKNWRLKGISWHPLRHTFATYLVATGAQLPVVQQLLGHSDIAMTMRYVHVLENSAASAVNRLIQAYQDVEK